MTNNLRRFVIAQKKLGNKELGGGMFAIDFNTGADGSHHTKYQFKDGALSKDQMLATGYCKIGGNHLI